MAAPTDHDGSHASVLDDLEQLPPPNRHRRRLSWWLTGGAVALILVLVGVIALNSSGGDGGTATDDPAPAGGEWMSGAAGVGVVSGDFGEWRGRPVEIVGHWSDNNDDMVHLWGLQPGFELEDYVGPMDAAIGAIGEGETWAAAAQGAYDERWRQSLTNLRAIRLDRGPTYIRFAHESNGNWYQWSVDATEVADFRAAWQRFRALQQEIYPESQLVFCVNRESVNTGVDWRETFPGAEYVDVYSVDYYNQWPWVGTAEEWAESMDDVDQFGGPKGLEGHRQFAESVGLPMAVSEWSNNAEFGDSPAFMRAMHDFFAEHAGDGPGEVLYEIQFNAEGYDDKFRVYGDNVLMPEAAEAYRELW
ncbi:glycosyl hydrolase [Geodermatophilus nigrescens]